jgi:hypothetical protein
MTATKVRSAEDQALVEQRLVEWKDFLNVASPRQAYLAEEYVAASVRVTRCRKEEDDWRAKRASRAQDGTWDTDRRGEAAELGKGLARNPRVVAAKLRGSYHGAEWLLAEWRALAEAIRNPDGTIDAAAGQPAPLDEAGRAKACDLLGLAAEHRQGRTPLDLPQGGGTDAALAAHQVALVAREIGMLERLVIEELTGLEAMEKTAAAEGRSAGIPRELRLIRRYHAAAQRDYDRWLGELRAEQERAAKAAADEVFNVINAAKLRRAQERQEQARQSQNINKAALESPSAPAGSGAAEILPLAASRPTETPSGAGAERPSDTLPGADAGSSAFDPKPGEMTAILDGLLARIARKEARQARSADRGIGPK